MEPNVFNKECQGLKIFLNFEVWGSQVFGWKKTKKYFKILIYGEFKFSKKLLVIGVK